MFYEDFTTTVIRRHHRLDLRSRSRYSPWQSCQRRTTDTSMRNYMRILLVSLIVISAGVSGRAQSTPPPTNVTIPAGYTMTAAVTGLTFPTALTFFGDTIWVTEAGIGGGAPTVK